MFLYFPTPLTKKWTQFSNRRLRGHIGSNSPRGNKGPSWQNWCRVQRFFGQLTSENVAEAFENIRDSYQTKEKNVLLDNAASIRKTDTIVFYTDQPIHEQGEEKELELWEALNT